MATYPRSKDKESSEEQVAEDSAGLSSEAIDSGDVVENLRHLLPLVCVSDGKYSTSKRVRYLNDLAKVIKKADYVIEPNYPVERIIECARLSLLSTIKEVRAGGLRVLRYLLTSREAFLVMLRHCIDFLVARCLDAPPIREIERLQAIRFIRQALAVSPQDFPSSLVFPLVAILLSPSEPQDNLTWSSTATLCELALNNPELAARTGTIKALVQGLLKCYTFRISESVVLTLSHLLNSPCSRKYIRSQFDVESLLAPITDLHYCHQPNIQAPNLSIQSNNTLRVEASKMALISLLKCWPGIFCLCNQRNLGVTSLLNMLPLAKSEVQREILDVLFGVFQLKVPEWTSNYNDAVASIDPAELKSEWSLTEGFVAEEGYDLLLPKSVDRTNLIDCYQALILAALVQERLFHVLVETVLTAKRHVTVMATILMGELLHLANIILPPEYSSDAHSLVDLIASAMNFHDSSDQRNRASEVISCLDRVHQLKKVGVKPSSLFLKLILDQSGYFLKKEEFNHISSELDEATLANFIRDTSVLLTKEYTKWDWRLLLALLQHPSLTTQICEDTLFSKFIKRLCNFYKPSNHLYSAIIYNEANSKRYSSVGQKLVKYLCRAEEGSTGYLYDLVSDIVMELSQVTASKLTADVFSSSSISHKLSRDYFLFLGTISFYKPLLLKQCKAYGPLLDICNYQNRGDLMKLIVSSLDFAHDIHSQVILGKILTSADQRTRLYATKHLRVLLRAKMPFFNSWGLELLIPQLYDTDKEVAIEAANILDEACEEDSFLKALVLQQPQLLHLGEKGAAIQTRFYSVKRGFALMSRLGYLDSLQENWSKRYNKLYVYIVEEKLAETLTSFNHVQQEDFVRRSNTNVINPKAFVPVHLYGQLAQHDEGCALLEKENYVPQFARVIRDSMNITGSEAITDFKAAIWALGHIGSAVRGLELLIKEGVVSDLVTLAEICPVLSIRGTAYYSVCLISKTPRGAEVLLKEDWATVCHSLAEKWPLNFDKMAKNADTIFLSPSTTPIKLETSAKSSFSSGDFSFPTAVQRNTQSVSNDHPPPKSPKLIKHHSTVTDNAPSHFAASRFRASSSHRNTKNIMSPQTGRGISFYMTPSTSVSSPQFKGNMADNAASSQFRSLTDFKRTSSTAYRQSISNSSHSYLGVCLPLDITAMFVYDEPSYEGFITETIGAPNFSKDTLPHNSYRCLECSLHLKKSHQRSQSDGSVSNEKLAYSNLQGKTSSSNSLSSDNRSHSYTIESIVSSGSSNSNTPHSQSLTKTVSSSNEVDTTPNREKDSKGDTESKKVHTEEGIRRSPLLQVKRIINLGPEGGHVVDSDSKLERESDSKVNIPSVSGSGVYEKDSSSASGEVGKEEEEEGVQRGGEVRSPSSLEVKDNSSTSGEVEEDEDELKKERGGDEMEEDEDELKEERRGDGGEVKSSSLNNAKEVMITVIEPSVPAKGRDPQLQPAGTGRPAGTGERDKDNSDTGSVSSIGQSSTAAADNSKLHAAYLEVVYGLSSDVSLKKNTTTLNMLSQKHPQLCQDVCLYSKMAEFLSTYQYSLNTRRFIQAKFEKLKFSTVFAARPQLDEEFSEDDFLSSTCSSRRESFSSQDTTDNTSVTSNSSYKLHRRGSSTSDAAKFREKLHSLSQSVEMHEHLVVESPREKEYEEKYRTATEEKNCSTEELCAVTYIQPQHNTSGIAADSRSDRLESEEEEVDEKKYLNLTRSDETRRKSNSSEMTVASVLNVGFDL